MAITQIKRDLESQGIGFLMESSCWEYHTAKLDSIRAKVMKDIFFLFEGCPEITKVLVVVGDKTPYGRHKTNLYLFDGSSLGDAPPQLEHDCWVVTNG